MPTPNFVNPFTNPIFAGLLIRLIALFMGTFIVLYMIYRGNTKKLFASNVGARFWGWLLLTPFYVVGVFMGRVAGIAMIFSFMAMASYEFVKIAKLERKYFGALVALSVWSIITAAFLPAYFYSLPLVYFTVASLLAIRSNDPKHAFERASVVLYAAIWLLFGLSHGILLSRFNNTLDTTRGLLFLVIFATGLADIGGFVFGKLFERFHFLTKYKVAEQISPNKTYAGTLGYIIGAGLAIWILRFSLPPQLTNLELAGAAIVIGTFSFIGGLTHSFFKRYYNVKDSGHLIPGHGGIMDRIDSLARVTVLIYYYFLIVL